MRLPRELPVRIRSPLTGQQSSGESIKPCHWPALSCLAILLCTGCATYPVNAPLEAIDTENGYRLNNRVLGPNNSDNLFIVLGLSGGGARAAALDYGIIKYLDSIRFGDDNRSLLDEVDIISTSSAASIPAAYYGLFGKDVFIREFKEDVLYRSIQSGLLKRALNPVHWPRLMSSTFSRGDLAAEYLDQHIFNGLTFADMSLQRPLILLNATDIGIGSQLSFVQSNFDLLCSDLSTFPVSRAVTASLSFTPAFTPITLKNYNDGSCGYSTPKWAKDVLVAGVETDSSVYAAARDVLSYEDIEHRPYVHLLDSGISDNVGIRSPALAFSVRDSPASQIERIEDGTIERLVVVLVDAKPKTHFRSDLKPKPPNAITSVRAAASTPLANYSYETVSILRKDIRDAQGNVAKYHSQRRTCKAHARSVCTNLGQPAECFDTVLTDCYSRFRVAEKDQPVEPEFYLMHVSFELLDDEGERDRYQSIPTKLELPREDIDALIGIAPELMNQTPDFHLLLQDLDARIRN